MSNPVRVCGICIWLCASCCGAATLTAGAQPGTDSADARANLNEYRLSEINAELEASRPASPVLPGMDERASPDNPAKPVSRSSEEAVKAVEAEISSSLHRLYRETREVRKPGARENVIEEKQQPQP
jgi:hypothetical protein